MLVYGIDLHKPPGEGRPCTWNIAPALSLYFRLRSGCSFSNEHWNYPNSQAAKWSKNEATEMSTYFFRTKSWIEGHKCNQAYIYIYIEHHRTWLNQQQTNFNATTSRTWKCTGVEWNPTVHWWCNLENIVKTRRYPTEERERKGGYLMLLGAILLVTNLKVEHLHGVDLSSSSEPSTVNLASRNVGREVPIFTCYWCLKPLGTYPFLSQILVLNPPSSPADFFISIRK